MATRTFTGNTTFVVPDDNSEVTIRCYGGAGNGGNANSSGDNHTATNSGANGGYAEGVRNVSAGETLYIQFPNGGSGGNASHGGDVSANGGNGGDGAAVHVNNTDQSNAIIVAGGGGGGGAACADDFESNGTAATSGGAGGGNGQDANDADPGQTDGAGGTGGGSGGAPGGNGRGKSRNHSAIGTAGAGGGGGGGHDGGGGGGAGAISTSFPTGYFDYAAGAGGGGGDGYVGGVSSSNQQNGVNSGGAYIEIDYTPTPNPPTTLNRTVNHQAPHVDVFWDIYDSITDGFYVYRSESSGFSPSTSNRIATISNGSATSYTDTTVERGVEYFYKVSAFESTSTNESGPSIQTEAIAGEVFKIDEDGTFTQYPIKYWNGSEWDFASELWVRIGDDAYSSTAYGESAYSGSTSAWQEQ